MKKTILFMGMLLVVVACSREELNKEEPRTSPVMLSQIAEILAELPIESAQVQEVFDAVNSSISNGYDEEYTMSSLFASPGRGVGEKAGSTKAAAYATPLRDLFADYAGKRFTTKAGDPDPLSAEQFLKSIEESGAQIYWPYSGWDGKSLPVITYDPGFDTDVNNGYEIIVNPDGSRSIREIIVSEETARTRPVWVVNSNDDSMYETLQTLRRDGLIVEPVQTKAESSEPSDARTLVLRNFMATRSYDSWFGGASEFFIKAASIEDFTASTEAELRLYQPSITDFMIVVKRKDIGLPLPMNSVLISKWTSQLEDIAFMIIEDDGGTLTSWKCEANVKLKSKTYGFDIEIPLYSRDDIVWRGKLSSSFLEKYHGKWGRFGDVAITFDFI